MEHLQQGLYGPDATGELMADAEMQLKPVAAAAACASY